MPGPQEAISSARCKLFLFQGGSPGDGIPIPLVENVTFRKSYTPETIFGVGDPLAQDIVENTEAGMVSWGKVHTDDPQLLEIIVPKINRWNKHQPFNVLAIDPETNDPIALAVGVKPDTLELSTRAGAAMRQNYSGPCKKVLLGDEIREAASR